MRQFFFYICLALMCFSLKGIAHSSFEIKTGADTGYINTLSAKADNVLDPDSAIALYDQVIRLSVAANYAEGAFMGLMLRGLKYGVKEDYVKSRNDYIKALDWAGGSNKKDAFVWSNNNIGISYFSEGNYTNASQYYYRALDEIKKLPPLPIRTAANVYINLGIINMRIGQHDKGLAFFYQAEKIARKGSFDYQLALVLIDKGEYYIDNRQPDSAINLFSELMEISKKMNRIDLEAQANIDLGRAFSEKGEYAKAATSLEKAMALAKGKFDDIVTNASYSLGEVWYHTGKYKDAETMLTFALKEAVDHNIKDIYIDCYTKLEAVYRATGQYQKALNCMDSILELKERLTGTENAKAINQMEIKYQTAEKDRELARNELLIAQQKGNLIRKNIWISVIAGSIFIVALIFIIVYRNVRHKQYLQAEQIRSMTQENRISVLKALMEGEEKERGRIAGELHDGIGGMLSAAMMRFNVMHHENSEITKIPAYHDVMQLLDDTADEIRKTAHNLMPEVLLKQTLPEALRVYCNTVQDGKKVKIDFQSYGDFDSLSQGFKLNIYRIVQELLKNITQHANATNALVQVLMHEQMLTITVEDNGIGFNAGGARKEKGIGLHNLQTRVSSLGGQFTLSSEPEKGTSVYIEFEVKQGASIDDQL
jgi:signal transduction histidine kinase/Tfp pilus assembly protein PilF